MTIYARKGEVSTCINGHPLGTFKRDVMVGAPIAGNDDIDLAPGMKWGELWCPTCGEATNEFGAMYFGGAPSRGFDGLAPVDPPEPEAGATDGAKD